VPGAAFEEREAPEEGREAVESCISLFSISRESVQRWRKTHWSVPGNHPSAFRACVLGPQLPGSRVRVSNRSGSSCRYPPSCGEEEPTISLACLEIQSGRQKTYQVAMRAEASG
jgi:hypothetical protein